MREHKNYERKRVKRTRGEHERKGKWEGGREGGPTEDEEEEGEGVGGDDVVTWREGQGANVIGAWKESDNREKGEEGWREGGKVREGT